MKINFEIHANTTYYFNVEAHLEIKGHGEIDLMGDDYDYIPENMSKEEFVDWIYDTYLIDYNLLIEFHGRQHYEPVEAFGGEEEFKETIKRDAFKRSLAREYKIPLLEFNYKQLKELSKEKFEEFVISKIKSR